MPPHECNTLEMSTFCEVTWGAGGTWLSCPPFLRSVWARSKREWFRCCSKVIISLRIVPAASVPLTWLNAMCFEIRSRPFHLVACQRTVGFWWRIVRLINILLLFRIVRIQFIKANSLLFRTLVYNSCCGWFSAHVWLACCWGGRLPALPL